ncbi:hypothetical protein GQX74_006366 [Glossina fuscipes]|nr:hypothetical protein GQX74_006366 [Glossina fuscipes]
MGSIGYVSSLIEPTPASATATVRATTSVEGQTVLTPPPPLLPTLVLFAVGELEFDGGGVLAAFAVLLPPLAFNDTKLIVLRNCKLLPLPVVDVAAATVVCIGCCNKCVPPLLTLLPPPPPPLLPWQLLALLDMLLILDGLSEPNDWDGDVLRCNNIPPVLSTLLTC